MELKIDINRASKDELTQIIHIGPIMADMIIENRPYRDIYEISTVLGLGKKRMNDILEQDIIQAIPLRVRQTQTKEKPPKTFTRRILNMGNIWNLKNK